MNKKIKVKLIKQKKDKSRKIKYKLVFEKLNIEKKINWPEQNEENRISNILYKGGS